MINSSNHIYSSQEISIYLTAHLRGKPHQNTRRRTSCFRQSSCRFPHTLRQTLAVGFLPRGKGAVPLGGGTVCRHIFKRDNLHLCGAGNATRLHIAAPARPCNHPCAAAAASGFKQAEQPRVGALLAAKNVVQNFIGAVAVIKTDIVEESTPLNPLQISQFDP